MAAGASVMNTGRAATSSLVQTNVVTVNESMTIAGQSVLPVDSAAVDGLPLALDSAAGELVSVPTTADRYYVDGLTGSNLNNGLSPASAFSTIQAGIDAAGNGDAVLVGSRSTAYVEDLTIDGKTVYLFGPQANVTGTLSITGSGASFSRVILNQVALGASRSSTAVQIYSGATDLILKIARLSVAHPSNTALILIDAGASATVECGTFESTDMFCHSTAHLGTLTMTLGEVLGGRSARCVFGGGTSSKTYVTATNVDVAGDLFVMSGTGEASLTAASVNVTGRLSNFISTASATMFASRYTGSTTQPGSGRVADVTTDGTDVRVRASDLVLDGTNLDITATTASSSTSTGALVCDGGAGIAGDLNVGGDAGVAGLTFDSGTNVLDHYATATETLTYSGPLSNVDAGVTLTRVGGLVTMTIATVSGLGNSTAALITSTAISAAFRPPGAVHATALVNPGSAPEIRSTVHVSSTGVMTFFNGAAVDVTNTFAATGGGIVIQPFSVSWHV